MNKSAPVTKAKRCDETLAPALVSEASGDPSMVITEASIVSVAAGSLDAGDISRSRGLFAVKRPSVVSAGSQTKLSMTDLCVARYTKDQAKDQFDNDEDFDYGNWFKKHTAADGTVSQHQIDMALLEQKHQSARWLQNNIIHNLERKRHIYAELMRNIKTVRV